MAANFASLVRRGLKRAGGKLIALSERVPGAGESDAPVEILEREGSWVVCRAGDYIFRLDPTQCVDADILDDGLFEPHSTTWVERLVRPGQVVADVGANLGYYTVRFSRLVGPQGHVHAFEPSPRYRARLQDHLRRNDCERNVTVSEFALSDREGEEHLYGDDVSASIHWVHDARRPSIEETIRLKTLDAYAREADFARLDFVKVDIDGHEPRFVAGAAETLRRFRPAILMEFAQLNLLTAGSDVDQLAAQLGDLGYSLYSERTGELYTSRTTFLVDVMNCAHTANVICLHGTTRAHIGGEATDERAAERERERVAAGGVV
ncbi:MAG TPA: FkbM family methyltransferase [Pyrinomonadaceae bacterium]|nr:FkbM family methyltransferase [Pyrinomonadaceae bacterium]